MRRLTLLAVLLCGAGCGGNDPAGAPVKRTRPAKPGVVARVMDWLPGSTARRVEAEARERERLAAEAEARQNEQRRLLEEKQAADVQVQQWADRLVVTPGQYEGLTEADPWGNLLQLSYSQELTEEVIEVRSYGPDGVASPIDDLWRTRRRQNLAGLHRGLGVWGFVGVGWVVCGLLALGGTKVKGRHRRKQRPVLSGLVIMILSPVVLVVYILLMFLSILGALVGHGGSFEGGFDLFDIDLDFD